MRIGRRTVYWPVTPFPVAQSGRVRIEAREYPAGHVFQTTNPRTAFHGHLPRKIVVDYPTTYHFLREGGQGTWMSDLPIEQAQHDTLLAGMRGHVLVGGLGLGYAVTELCRKHGVKSVTVIERSSHIIDLVWRHLPPIVHDKAVIEHKDLFVYLKSLPEFKIFDYAFYDIWQLDGESTFHSTVMPLRHLSRNKVRIVRCWNEDIMRSQLLQGIHSRLIMLRHPEMLVAPSTLDGLWRHLTTPTRNPFTRWAAPFWQRVQREGLNSGIDWELEGYYYVIGYGK